jgi:hypothetical protein
MANAPRKSKAKSRNALMATAYHEAGHAVSAWYLGFEVRSVGAVPSGDALGTTRIINPLRGVDLEWSESAEEQRLAENFALHCLAGPAAQQRYDPHSFRVFHDSGDRTETLQVLGYFTASAGELSAYYQLVQIRARQFVRVAHHWRVIEELAERVFRRRRLSGNQVKAFVSDKWRSRGQLIEQA